MTDLLVRTIAKEVGVRALACVTTELVSDAVRRHDAMPVATAALGYGLTAAALLGGLLKVQQRVALKVQGDGPLVVREKFFEATPLTLAQALDEMELVGHDFFLFIDDATGQPCVCYRRRGWTYGIIRLNDTVKGWQGDSQGQAALEATV